MGGIRDEWVCERREEEGRWKERRRAEEEGPSEWSPPRVENTCGCCKRGKNRLVRRYGGPLFA